MKKQIFHCEDFSKKGEGEVHIYIKMILKQKFVFFDKFPNRFRINLIFEKKTR